MQISGKKILNESEFIEKFDFFEVNNNLKALIFDLKGISFLDNKKKTRLLDLLSNALSALENANSQGLALAIDLSADNFQLVYEKCSQFVAKPSDAPAEITVNILEPFKQGLTDLYEHLKCQSDLTESGKASIFCVVFALFSLAQRPINDVEKIVATFKNNGKKKNVPTLDTGQSNTSSVLTSSAVKNEVKTDDIPQQAHADSKQTDDELDLTDLLDSDQIDLWNSDKPYRLSQYDFSSEKDAPLRIVKLNNHSTSQYGSARIEILSPKNDVLQSLTLTPGDSTYILTKGGKIIARVSDLSCSNTHYIQRMWKDNQYSLHICSVKDQKELRVFHQEKCSNLSQFCADDENGFIGVSNGRLVIFSNISDFIEIPENPHYVWISVLGAQYMGLTRQGDVVSNFWAVNGWKNMLWVSFTDDNEAYGIRDDGQVLFTGTTDIQEQLATFEKVVEVSACKDSFILRTLDGKLATLNCCLDRQFNGIRLVRNSQKGTLILDENSSVWLGSSKIEDHVDEITVFDYTIILKKKEGNPIIIN